jgi:hypothetical protein
MTDGAYINDTIRTKERQAWVKLLHDAGPRAVLECLIAVEHGYDLDDTLKDFARVPTTTYQYMCASDLPIRRYLRVGKWERTT